ncbi:MAG: PEP-utilizing enzyme, partial [Oscillospiraceae bacterium]
ISGVAFTVNPVSGNDSEIIIEAAAGQGENLVSGKVCAQHYGYNWFENKTTVSGGPLLDERTVRIVADAALSIQMLFGYPCDIEFAFEKGVLYILQARAVTKIMYGGIAEQWTTADFKDGGVSATVCTPYMWSLYEYIWENEFRSFIVESKILKASRLKKLSNMFFGRPYWNLSVAKAAMARAPGYKEREFDNELGVKISYDGNGVTTKITPKTIAGIAVMAFAQRKIVGERRKNAEALKDGLLKKYYSYLSDAGQEFSGDKIRFMWKALIFEDYLKSESTYFRQIFINTIHQSLFKDKLLKRTSKSGYFRLIGGLDNISHLLPFYNIWSISREIRSDKAALSLWCDSSVKQLRELFDTNSDDYCMGKLREHIKRFGYHSKKELDVTYPCYYEDINTVIIELKEAAALDEVCSPDADRKRLHAEFEKELEKIESTTGKRAFEGIRKSVFNMRKMLWWREEFRDVSTRFYYIIRIYTLMLARQLVSENILDNQNDIWFSKIADMRDYLDGSIDKAELRRIIERNKKYYRSFRNFTGENEIGHSFDRRIKSEKNMSEKKLSLNGVGCNNGIVTGTARLVESLDQTSRLEVGDILITKFTDTGWTSKFAILSGIVTEYGGILCHAAIVSREYGIPCVVCAENATRLIKDGSEITINGETGQILLNK